MFRDQFDRARAAGLRSVPHAGETTGPDSVWDALISLGAERIEHASRPPAISASWNIW
jgi:aminodeoxyfutalosine deaminase